MTRLLPVVGFILYTLAGEVFAQQTESSLKMPPVQWTRPRHVDMKHIALDLQFDWVKKQAKGIATLTFAPFKKTTKIALDAGLLSINSITLPDGTQLTYAYDGGDKNDGLVIFLNKEYDADQDITIQIDYHTNYINQIDPVNLSGTTGKGLRFSLPTSNDPIKPKEIWSIGEPDLNRYWFPCYDAPNDLRTTEFKATIEKNLIVISNGILIDKKQNTDGTHTFHWKAEKPYANHLTNFIVCHYVNTKQQYAGIELNNYGYPHEQEATMASVERLPDMIRFFSGKIGVKYPYPSYSQAFVQDLPWGVAGNGLSAQTENMVDDYRTHADYLYLWDGLEGESLAAQWFGNYLSPKDWSHYWLSRGFAHYFSGLYNAYKNGNDEFLLWQIASDQASYIFDWNSGNRHPIVTKYYESAANFCSDSYSYNRGAMVLRTLHQQLGDEIWWKVINHYVKTNAYRTVTTDDFQQAIEDITGDPMDWFFDQWVYKMGHPVFEITKNFDTTKKELVLKVKQVQKIDTANKYPQTTFFQGRIPIEIDDRIELIWIEPKAENSFSFTLTQQPELVNFDFQRTWISEITSEKSQDELLRQLHRSTDVLARGQAISDLIKIAKNEKTSPDNKANIVEGIREVAMSNAYWRLRMTALGQLQNLLASTPTNKPATLDKATVSMLMSVIKNSKSWLKASAIWFLGQTRDPKYNDIYLQNLTDSSDRVINAAAASLGKTKDPKAFGALVKLMGKPSMKSQSRLSALNGLKELGDPRGSDVAYQALSDLYLPRWRLPDASVWDYRVFAVQLIASFGKTDQAFQLLYNRFKKSMAEKDLDGIFNNTLLIAILANPRGQEVFDQLRSVFKDDSTVRLAVDQYERQWKQAMEK